MPEPPVVLRREGGLAHLVLNAPPGNAMDGRFFETLSSLAPDMGSLGVRGMVVRGAGRHFSSGADLGELRSRLAAGSAEGARLALAEASRAFQSLAELPFPTVAAVSGACLGSGLELALACRFRICATSAVFALPEATFGLMPGCGGTVRLPGLVGLSRALELILTGRTVGAEEAHAMGLVDAVTGRSGLVEAAQRLLLRLAPGKEGGAA